MKLKNINLKKVIPIAAIVVVLVITIICLVTCDNNKDTSTSTTITEAEATDTSDIANNETTEEQTTANDTVKDETENNTLASVENTSDAPDPQTTVENKTTANNQSTTKKPQSTYKPNNNEKETTTKCNIIEYVTSTTESTTTNNNSNNNEEETEDNGIGEYIVINDEYIKITEDLYVVSSEWGPYDYYEDIKVTYEGNKKITTLKEFEKHGQYTELSDGRVLCDTRHDIKYLYELIEITEEDMGEYINYRFLINQYYKVEEGFNTFIPHSNKGKVLFDKYYKQDYELGGYNYPSVCEYIFDKKTNKTFSSDIELYTYNVVNELKLANSSMSKEKKIYTVLEYTKNNAEEIETKFSFFDLEEIQSRFLNELNINSESTHYGGYSNSAYADLLVQMEDGLLYNVYLEDSELHIDICKKEDYPFMCKCIDVPFATSETTNLAYKEFKDDNGNYSIPFSKLK